MSGYNSKNPSIKRILKEALELSNATDQYYAQPHKDNIYVWHFTIRGPSDSPFSKGIYHGQINLPSNYPFQAPDIIFFTPNSKFEVNQKICLNVTTHHPEFWRPSWSIRTVLLALIAYFNTNESGPLGSIERSKEDRQKIAEISVRWKCNECGKCNEELLKPKENHDNQNIITEDVEEISLITFKQESNESIKITKTNNRPIENKKSEPEHRLIEKKLPTTNVILAEISLVVLIWGLIGYIVFNVLKKYWNSLH